MPNSPVMPCENRLKRLHARLDVPPREEELDESDIAVDLYRSRELAEEELRQAIEDEPGWINVLSVVQVDLPEPRSN